MPQTHPFTSSLALLADEILADALPAGSQARSPAFVAGARAGLALSVEGTEGLACNFPAGSADFDAFFAGVDEAEKIAKSTPAVERAAQWWDSLSQADQKALALGHRPTRDASLAYPHWAKSMVPERR